MRIWRQKAKGILTCTLCLGFFIAQPGLTATQSVKTSLKRYAVHSFGDQKVLCEPYNVAKDDWLYKIFRQKGEISEKDFPLFLAIFKSINPDISNIDAINPGQQILIPLKTIHQEDFDESVPGVVDVPVVEFATLEKKIPSRYKRHRVKVGDTVSQLIDPIFLKKDGTLTQQGIDLFLIANPGTNGVHLIQEGSVLNLPIPNQTELILAVPENNGVPFMPAPVTAKDIAALKQFTRTHRGELLENGKYYFPAKGSPDLVLDLAYTPIIRFQNGTRIIMVPDRNHYREMEKTVRVYWPGATLVDLPRALETVTPKAQDRPGEKPPGNSQKTALNHRVTAAMLVKLAGFEYESDSVIRLQMDTLDLEIKVGKILRREKPDLLVEYGDVYGFALDLIHEQGYELISLLPGETMRELAVKLFTGLGIQVVENPAFISTRTYRTITIPGVYIPCPTGKIMLVDQGLDLETEEFLHHRSISILRTNLPDWEAKPEI
ncbi:MAG: hypothetical protein RBR67_00235 [Desulfobacterium sp.]|jgi:hypothetical protein|nr:hypothetical protein [Desulfobacterium sp.]